jgi:ABC-type Fe3+/spermidine/putrescine transport system ATPase subunit
LSGLHKRLSDTTAVEEVSLEIEGGEFFRLLGPSGSGKTTLLRMIAGLETPTDGTIYLNGADVTDDQPSRRNVSTVFQNYALFPHMTVSENIGYGLEVRGESSEAVTSRVEELLDLVNLSGVGDRYPDSLSGGQQQRVALSRALAIEPEVLLLDEPLDALDQKLRQEMQVKLKETQREVVALSLA